MKFDFYMNETLAYMLYDHATEKIICFCDSEAQLQEAQEHFISECTRNHKPYDLYKYANID